jgi:mannose-6-phosphate isomerase-like protein (cupin superfamily)
MTLLRGERYCLAIHPRCAFLWLLESGALTVHFGWLILELELGELDKLP